MSETTEGVQKAANGSQSLPVDHERYTPQGRKENILKIFIANKSSRIFNYLEGDTNESIRRYRMGKFCLGAMVRLMTCVASTNEDRPVSIQEKIITFIKRASCAQCIQMYWTKRKSC